MKKTNIIFVLADDMGYGDFGKFSRGNAITPNLDKMADEGVCLTQCYAESPVCTPSRAAILTGRYHHRTGAIDMRELRGLSRMSLKETTIADIFKMNGYATGLIGKWHNGTIGDKYHPNARGFDTFVGFRGGMSAYYDWNLYYNGEMKKSDGRYLTDVFTDESIKFINDHKNGPFFLNIAYNAPHSPLEAPEEDIKIFSERGLYTRGVSATYAMILCMDRGIGKIFNELKRLGIDEDTLVLFTSDNGPQFGGQGEMRTDRFNCELAGSKGVVYEGGIKVPCVIRQPGRIVGGAFNNCFAHGTDWLPTLAAAADIKIPENIRIDGQNIFGQITGEQDSGEVKRFWQWNRYDPMVTCNAAMRDGAWKLVRPPIPEAMTVIREDFDIDRIVEKNPEAYPEIINPPMSARVLPPPAPPRLYDLEADPFEQNDLAAVYPERVSEMLKELEEWFNEVETERRSITE